MPTSRGRVLRIPACATPGPPRCAPSLNKIRGARWPTRHPHFSDKRSAVERGAEGCQNDRGARHTFPKTFSCKSAHTDSDDPHQIFTTPPRHNIILLRLSHNAIKPNRTLSTTPCRKPLRPAISEEWAGREGEPSDGSCQVERTPGLAFSSRPGPFPIKLFNCH